MSVVLECFVLYLQLVMEIANFVYAGTINTYIIMPIINFLLVCQICSSKLFETLCLAIILKLVSTVFYTGHMTTISISYFGSHGLLATV